MKLPRYVRKSIFKKKGGGGGKIIISSVPYRTNLARFYFCWPQMYYGISHRKKLMKKYHFAPF